MMLFDWLQEKYRYNLIILENKEDVVIGDLDIIVSGGEIMVIFKGE